MNPLLRPHALCKYKKAYVLPYMMKGVYPGGGGGGHSETKLIWVIDPGIQTREDNSWTGLSGVVNQENMTNRSMYVF